MCNKLPTRCNVNGLQLTPSKWPTRLRPDGRIAHCRPSTRRCTSIFSPPTAASRDHNATLHVEWERTITASNRWISWVHCDVSGRMATYEVVGTVNPRKYRQLKMSIPWRLKCPFLSLLEPAIHPRLGPLTCSLTVGMHGFDNTKTASDMLGYTVVSQEKDLRDF